ncbi:MAG: LemA family protein [Cyclobacteriaceae bacterium]|jgi:LemA protein|nr:LemA family protein [Cyclobacteriaceae bacterium]
MKKLLTIGLIVVVAIVLYRLFAGTYNNLVTEQQKVESQWAQVENVYQRRADLIPNLVNTVKGYADFEQETLTRVIEARAKATSITVDADDLTPEKVAEFQAAQSELSTALGRLLVSVERYPDLKANQNFLDLQTQLEGTENRIAVERMKFNETVRSYNTYVKTFPRNLLAGMYGFEERGYFDASPEAEQVPQVQF